LVLNIEILSGTKWSVVISWTLLLEIFWYRLKNIHQISEFMVKKITKYDINHMGTSSSKSLIFLNVVLRLALIV
jgi:hypothetical protein